MRQKMVFPDLLERQLPSTSLRKAQAIRYLRVIKKTSSSLSTHQPPFWPSRLKFLLATAMDTKSMTSKNMTMFLLPGLSKTPLKSSLNSRSSSHWGTMDRLSLKVFVVAFFQTCFGLKCCPRIF